MAPTLSVGAANICILIIGKVVLVLLLVVGVVVLFGVVIGVDGTMVSVLLIGVGIYEKACL